MSMEYNEIFSKYDVPKASFMFDGEEKASVIDTVGTETVASEVRTVTKKKRNMPWKRRTKETGSGTVDLSLHIPMDIYTKMYNADQPGYKDNVAVFGNFCIHKTFAYRSLVEDEDGNQMLQSFPKCTMISGISESVETNGEEVAQVDLSIAYDPDDDGVGLYKMVLGEPSDENEAIITSWLESFATDMVKAGQ